MCRPRLNRIARKFRNKRGFQTYICVISHKWDVVCCNLFLIKRWFRAGVRLHNYNVLSLLGEGSSGKVFLIADRRVPSNRSKWIMKVCVLKPKTLDSASNGPTYSRQANICIVASKGPTK